MKSGAACPSRFLYSRYQIYKDDGFSCTRPGRHGDSRFHRRPSGYRACLYSPHSTVRPASQRPQFGPHRSPPAAAAHGLCRSGASWRAPSFLAVSIVRRTFSDFVLRRWTALRNRPSASPISLSVKSSTRRKIKMLCSCSGRPAKASNLHRSPYLLTPLRWGMVVVLSLSANRVFGGTGFARKTAFRRDKSEENFPGCRKRQKLPTGHRPAGQKMNNNV